MDRDDEWMESHRRDAPPGLFLSRRGAWYHDGDPVRHPRLEGLLHRSIARAADGGLVVTTGRDVLPFASEDAPVLVRTVERIDVGSPGGTEHELSLVLSTGDVERLGDNPLLIDDAGHLRTVVRDGQFWALFSRSATQAVLALLDDGGSIATARGPVPLTPIGSRMDWSGIPPDTFGGSADR